MHRYEKAFFIIGILISSVGIAATFIAPWPVDVLAEKLSLSIFKAKLLVCFVIVFIVIIVGILALKLSKNPADPIQDGVVGEVVVFTFLLKTLEAFQAFLISLHRELENEHELTRKNKKYHLDKIRKFNNIEILDSSSPWLLHSSSSPKWRPHLSKRKELDKGLENIEKILNKWHLKACFLIPYAAHQTGLLLKSTEQALEKLRVDGKNVEQKI